MSPIVKNILGVAAGLVIGMICNMLLIEASPYVIALPEGVEPKNMDQLKQAISGGQFEAKHYIMPLLAHSSQAFFGAFTCTKIAANRQFQLSMLLGAFEFVGGIMVADMLGTPMMPTTIDLVVAYFPMAWLGWKLAKN